MKLSSNMKRINSLSWWLNQPTEKWLNISDIPDDIFLDVWDRIERSNVLLNGIGDQYLILTYQPEITYEIKGNKYREYDKYSKPVIRGDGKEYSSLTKACKDNNTDHKTIKRAIKTNIRAAGYYWEFKIIS